jgi:hypothetical protein
MHIAVTPSSVLRAEGRAPARALILGARLATRDVLALCRRLLSQAGSAMQLDQIAASSLSKVWHADGTVSAINLGWDLVLMVETAVRICADPDRYASMVRVLGVAVRASGARIALVEPPPSPCADDWRGIRRAVEAAARLAHADIVPAGLAWRVATMLHPGLPLTTPRGRITTLGAYLLACTIVHSVTGMTLPALGLAGVPDSHVALARRAALEAVAQDAVPTS